MLDKYNRHINYLRISVTDRCNFRCTYCMPAEGIQLMKHDDILSYDEIFEVAQTAVSLGVEKIRITGGEPLIRKGIVSLIGRIAKLENLKDFGLTTNGVHLKQYAQELSDAGLHRVNISLDTINPENFKKLTRIGDLSDVLEGIESAKKAGLFPIKINCVVKKSENEPDAIEVAKYCKENDLQIRYIREMDLEKGTFWKVKGGSGGECHTCNRIRLSSNGKIRPCLFNDLEYDIRKLGIQKAIELAVGNKPKSGTVNKLSGFYNIGG